jgi:predicted nucleotidyltransferase
VPFRCCPSSNGAALAGFTTRLRAAFPGRVAGVVLFGSRARGEGRLDSDLDVLVRIDASNGPNGAPRRTSRSTWVSSTVS